MKKVVEQYRFQVQGLGGRVWTLMIFTMVLFLGTVSEGFPQRSIPEATLSAGFSHTCAVLADGQVKCWGDNDHGQLGNGTMSNSLEPVFVKGLTNGKAVSGGKRHSCAVLIGGGVKCWGENASGQLGNGTTSNSPVPVSVIGITRAVGIGSGMNHNCAALADGQVKCWGDNHDGQLGNGTMSNSLEPVFVKGLTNGKAVSGGYRHSCAVLIDGGVKCWGGGSLVPVTVSGITRAIAVSFGNGYSCAVLADGRVQCWGKGHLGNDTTTQSLVPVTVAGVTNAVGITAGRCDYSCVLLEDGRVKCWGHNHFGALYKRRLHRDIFRIPVTVPNITNAVAIAAGDVHNCALLADGRVQCWGGWNTAPLLGNKIAVKLMLRQKLHSNLVTVKGLDNDVAISRKVPLSGE